MIMNNNPDHIEENEQDTGSEPNESGGLIFSSSIKITDPNTQEIILHVRGDN
jgi:hypothetical protein